MLKIKNVALLRGEREKAKEKRKRRKKEKKKRRRGRGREEKDWGRWSGHNICQVEIYNRGVCV